MKRPPFVARWGGPLLAVLFLLPLLGLRAEEAPKWLRRLAADPVSGAAPDAPAIVLLDETILTVDAAGRATWARRYAVKILTRAGLTEAGDSVYYLDKKDTVGEAEAWLLRAGNVARTEGPDKWFDMSAASPGAIYDETRAKRITFADDAVPGDIFACETKVEGPMLFAQEIYTWESPLPAVAERFVINVPAGWSVVPLLRGAAQPVATVSADSRTLAWELRDRSYRPRELWMDLHGTVEAQLMVNLVAGGGGKSGAPAVFHTWAEVADWEEAIATGQCDTDPALVATVHRLVAGCATDLEKIRALTGYVQKLRYVAVNRNLARGLGYRPRKASEVYAKGFGDCKDKSNLLRAMLREAGIQSYPVAALASEEREVYGDWPSLFQFNHAILAIKVDGQMDLPTVVQTPQWGPLLFFDSTDPETLVGDLPWYLQGSNVHVIAPGSGALVRLPDLPAERRWRAEQRVKLVLTAKGAVSGDCLVTGFAQDGARLRRAAHDLTAKELHDWAAGRIGPVIGGAAAQNVVCRDDALTGRFDIAFDISGTSFARVMPGGLSVVRLDVLNRDTIPTFAEKNRLSSVDVRPVVQDDEVTLVLPAGLAIEELPTRTVLNGPYGSYENSFEAKEGTIVFHRTLKLSSLVVPAADYPKLRQFLSSASKADRGAVVLRSVN